MKTEEKLQQIIEQFDDNIAKDHKHLTFSDGLKYAKQMLKIWFAEEFEEINKNQGEY